MSVFKEEQRFTQTWLIVLLIVSILPAFIIIGKAFADGEMGVLNFISVILFILLATGIIFIFKLKTRIDDIGIHYQFFPFHLKMKIILWKSIRQANTRKYDAISEFGGWGFKGGWLWKKKNGIAINVKGHTGIQLVLNDGKKILIGTQKKSSVDSILAKYFNNV